MTAGDPPSKPSTAPEAAVDKTKPSSSSAPQPAAPAAAPGTDGPPPVVKKRRGRPPGSKTKKRHKGLLAGAGSLYANLTGLGPSDPSTPKAHAGANGSSGDQSLLAKHNPNIAQPHKQKQQKGLHLAIMDTIACLQPADVGTPFASLADACDRLFPYHAVFEENFPAPSASRGSGTSASGTGGGPQGSGQGAVDLSFWSEWRVYTEEQCAVMGKKMELLEQRFQNCKKLEATEELMDAYQLELMHLNQATRAKAAAAAAKKGEKNGKPKV